MFIKMASFTSQSDLLFCTNFSAKAIISMERLLLVVYAKQFECLYPSFADNGNLIVCEENFSVLFLSLTFLPYSFFQETYPVSCSREDFAIECCPTCVLA